MSVTEIEKRELKDVSKIIHFPGDGPSDFWAYIDEVTSRLLNTAANSTLKTPEELTILLVNNYSAPMLTEASLKHLGLRYVVVNTRIKQWNNFIKLELVLDYLKRQNRRTP